MKTMTSVEAQNGFGRLLDLAQREAISITRHGRPAVFVISPRDMEDLLASRRCEAVAELEEWSARAKESMSPAQAAAAEALTDEDVVRMVHESR